MSFMKRTAFTLLFLFIYFDLHAAYLFLKDGSIIKGTVVNEGVAYIRFRTEDNKIEQYPRAQVLRVLYTELNMGKVFVQRRDGKVHVAHMVDEDRQSYTFRENLYKPEEFTLKREEVLFMAERNPSGLKGGEPEMDRVALEWLPSFEEMQYYNVYYKKAGEEYGTPLRAKDKTFELKNLDSNTEYTVKVTGVAGENDETGSTNEFTFRTKNRPPDPPAQVTAARNDDGSVRVTWEPAEDRDGQVVRYKVFADMDKETIAIGEYVDTTVTLADTAGIIRVQIVAVDEQGDESKPASRHLVLHGITPVIAPGVIMPIGAFGDMLGMGYGASLSFTKESLFGSSFEMALSAGFYYMKGIDSIDSDITKTGDAFFIPVDIALRYRFRLSGRFSMAPYIAGGGAYLKMPYTELVDDVPEDKEVAAPGPIVAAGTLIDYAATDRMVLSLRLEYGSLVTSEILGHPFLRTELGVGYRL